MFSRLWMVEKMGRKYKQRVDDEAKVDMTPMLDIVFIMLIFFIVTTSFVKEAGIEVKTLEKIPKQRHLLRVSL